LLGAGALLRPARPSPTKGEAFECGNPASGPAWGRFSVKFYLTAILFIVFDVEVVFMYPWAATFRSLGMFGFIEMAIFILVLSFGLGFARREGALEWDCAPLPVARPSCMSPDVLLERVAALLPGATRFPAEAARGEAVVVVDRAALPEALRVLRDHPELRFER